MEACCSGRSCIGSKRQHKGLDCWAFVVLCIGDGGFTAFPVIPERAISVVSHLLRRFRIFVGIGQWFLIRQPLDGWNRAGNGINGA